jgi:hypothetical protein
MSGCERIDEERVGWKQEVERCQIAGPVPLLWDYSHIKTGRFDGASVNSGCQSNLASREVAALAGLMLMKLVVSACPFQPLVSVVACPPIYTLPPNKGLLFCCILNQQQQ